MRQIHPKTRRDPEIWHQLNRLLTVVILVVVAGVGILTFYPQWTRRDELAKQLEDEQTKLAAEQLLQKQRTREVNLLQTDPEYVEIIARDKIDVMKEGETIFRLDTPKKTSSGTPVPAKTGKP